MPIAKAVGYTPCGARCSPPEKQIALASYRVHTAPSVARKPIQPHMYKGFSISTAESQTCTPCRHQNKCPLHIERASDYPHPNTAVSHLLPLLLVVVAKVDVLPPVALQDAILEHHQQTREQDSAPSSASAPVETTKTTLLSPPSNLVRAKGYGRKQNAFVAPFKILLELRNTGVTLQNVLKSNRARTTPPQRKVSPTTSKHQPIAATEK